MKRTYILSFLLCALLMAASHGVWLPKKVTLTFKLKQIRTFLYKPHLMIPA